MLQPALTHLVGFAWLQKCPWGHQPCLTHGEHPWGGDTPSTLRVRVSLLPLQRSSLLGEGGGAAWELTCLPGTWNSGGKGHGSRAKESWEDFQQICSLLLRWLPAWTGCSRFGIQPGELGWTPGEPFKQRAGWRVSCDHSTAWLSTSSWAGRVSGRGEGTGSSPRAIPGQGDQRHRNLP